MSTELRICPDCNEPFEAFTDDLNPLCDECAPGYPEEEPDWDAINDRIRDEGY